MTRASRGAVLPVETGIARSFARHARVLPASGRMPYGPEQARKRSRPSTVAPVTQRTGLIGASVGGADRPIRHHRAKRRLMIATNLYTGLRISEVLGPGWDDVT